MRVRGIEGMIIREENENVRVKKNNRLLERGK